MYNTEYSLSGMVNLLHRLEFVYKKTKIALFRQIEEKYVKAENVYIIADYARYYRSKKVKEFLENSKIKIIFLPPYSPNLNLIERLWRFFNKKILYYFYYETYALFKKGCMDVFKNIKIFKNELSSLLIDYFQIIRN